MNGAFPILCGFANFVLIGWIGIADGAKYLPRFMQNVLVAFIVYYTFWMLTIYVAGAKLDRRTRSLARYAIFAPWGFIILVTLNQLFSEPAETAPIYGLALLVLFISVPGEILAKKINGIGDDT